MCEERNIKDMRVGSIVGKKGKRGGERRHKKKEIADGMGEWMNGKIGKEGARVIKDSYY